MLCALSGYGTILQDVSFETFALYEDEIADFKDIDTILKKPLGHQLGLFAVIDLSGA